MDYSSKMYALECQLDLTKKKHREKIINRFVGKRKVEKENSIAIENKFSKT